MGLKGNLAVVNLADVFQMLSRGKSSGLLRVQAPEGTRFIELQDGFISLAGRATQYIQLGDLLLSRQAINDDNLNTATKIHKENGMVLGQVLIEMNYVSRANLDDSLRFLIEEEVCDLFTLREGEFDFLANATLDTKVAPGGGAIRLHIDPDSLLLEAARRADEWHELEQRITTQSLLFRLTEEGLRVYHDADGISDEGRTIMRLMQAKNTVEGIVQKSCLGRLNTNRMVLELWDAQLIEPVPKNEYMAHAKMQSEAGQLADAHRIAVQASKVGSPETIKLAIALIENLRKQMLQDEKPIVAQISSDKRGTETVKKQPAQNLIIKRSNVPWMKIALIGLVIIAAAAYGAYYVMTTVDPRVVAATKLSHLKDESMQLVYTRKFQDATNLAKNFIAPTPDLKAQHEKLKRDVQTEIDTQFTRDFSRLMREGKEARLTAPELREFKDHFKDYDGVTLENPLANKDYKRLIKILKELDDNISTALFKDRLDQLRQNLRQLTQDQLTSGYRDLIKDDPPETIAKEARADLYKLLLPGHDADRQLSQAREMLANGGFDTARKMNESVKAQFPGTKLAGEAEKNLTELAELENKAADELAKIRKMILQRKSDEARRIATQLLASRPPAAIQAETIVEMRKLQTDIPEEELQKTIAAANRSWEVDPKLARTKVLEVVNAYPFSETAANATLRVQLSSSPEGAIVTYKDRTLGKTPVVAELPVMGPLPLTFTLPGFEPYEMIENNFRGEKLQAVFIRKAQTSILTPVPATAGILAFKDLLLLAGGRELVVCNARTLEVLRRVNLEGTPLPIKNGERTEQPPPLTKNELKLRGLSANEEDAEAYVFVSSAGSYFFQIPSNGVDFYRVPCEPGAVGEPEMYRPRKAGGFKLISVVTKSGISVYSSERQLIGAREIPSGGGQDQPLGFAFDGDTYYVPRDNNVLYAVEGYRGDIKWKKQCDARISLPPAVNLEIKTAAVADIKGRVLFLDTDAYGKEKGHTDLGVSSSLGLRSAANGFVAALDDNTLVLIPKQGGPVSWTVPLPGRVLFTPLVRSFDPKDKRAIPTAVVCCETQNNYFVVIAVNLTDGSFFWRGRLSSRPLAGTIGADSVYIGTVDNELVKFDFTLPSGN